MKVKGSSAVPMGPPSTQYVGLPNRKKSKIVLRKDDVDPTNRSDRPDQHKWMAEHLGASHKAFSTRVKQLDASEYCSPETANA